MISSGEPLRVRRPPVDEDGIVAERTHGAHIVAGRRKPCGRARSDLAHLPEALLLEAGIAHREHLVDEQDLGSKCPPRQSEAHNMRWNNVSPAYR